MRIVLASASPRRRELLGQIGLKFEVIVSEAEEDASTDDPARMVEELSGRKAEAVLRLLEREGAAGEGSLAGSSGETAGEGSLAGSVEEAAGEESLAGGSGEAAGEESLAGSSGETVGEGVSAEAAGGCDDLLVIGADTVVSVEGRVLGKPADRGEAARMLSVLAGRSHEVYTGVTLLRRSASGQLQRKVFHERTVVTFYPMSGSETEEYVSTGDGLDKAGAYGVQGICARYIREIHGEYNNVVGLPVGRLYQEAKEWLT